MLPRVHILLVEDNPDHARTIEESLTDYQWPFDLMITHLDNGNDAIEFLKGLGPKDSRPDLMLLDLIMPDPDGYAVMEARESNPRAHGIPMVILTCSQDEMDMVKSLKHGAVAYLVKPFNPVALERLLPQLLPRLRKRMTVTVPARKPVANRKLL